MKISICTPTYNEKDNIYKLYNDIKEICNKNGIEYEHLVIDNNSNDGTIEILKDISKQDKNFKVIINNKNYGHIKSPFYGLMQTNGDASILMSSDFQDPVELIPKYINEWKNGNKIVLSKKISSEENKIFFSIRGLYYKFLNLISEDELSSNTTGSGIFDKEVINSLKKLDDPYPYFRGLISELGYKISFIEFNQPKRFKGETKNNLLTLYDIGMLGIVKHSRKPLRFMVLIGFLSSFMSLLTGLSYLFYKIIFWNSFSVGIAPIVIGLFLIASIQITLLGLIGEYIGVILLNQKKTPIVNEKERINFD